MKSLMKVYSVFLFLVFLSLSSQVRASNLCQSAVSPGRMEQIAKYLEQIERTEDRRFLDLDEVISLYKVKPSRQKEFLDRVAREQAQGIMWKENPRISVTGDTLNVAAFNLYSLEQLRLSYQFILEREQ